MPISILQKYRRYYRCWYRYSILTTLVIDQVSLAYTIILCLQTLYTFPFTFQEAPLDVNTRANCLNFAQALLTIALDVSSAPPPAPKHLSIIKLDGAINMYIIITYLHTIVSPKKQFFTTHSSPFFKPSEVFLNTSDCHRSPSTPCSIYLWVMIHRISYSKVLEIINKITQTFETASPSLFALKSNKRRIKKVTNIA